MNRSENVTLTEPRLIICEGGSDKAFLEHLLGQQQMTGFQVECPREETVGAGGYSAIAKLLAALLANAGWKKLKALYVVVDANSDPQCRFSEVQTWLRRVGCQVAEPFRVADGKPAAGVFLVPGAGRTGTLEHLLLEAVFAAQPILERCVDDFSKCLVHPCSWPDNQRAKMRLHALIAGCCEKDPASSLAWVWGRKGNPIPIDSPSFAEMAEFLRQFLA